MPLKPLLCSFIVLVGAMSAYAQTTSDANKSADSKTAESKAADTNDSKTTTAPETEKLPAEERLPVTIVLVRGGELLVDEVSESSDGFWYKRGNITTFLDRARVARIEHPKPGSEPAAPEPVDRPGKWSLAEAAKVKQFFLSKFNRPLPLSSFGQSDLHTRWGLDHRNGMDVNLHPDSVEGRALVAYLKAESIPFLAFRGPIPGVSTGPHIHVGNRSPRSYSR